MKDLSAKNLNNLVNAYVGMISAIVAIEGVEVPPIKINLDPRSTPLYDAMLTSFWPGPIPFPWPIPQPR